MVNYWSIAIGINQYQQFQPLIYAQRDAVTLRDFLVSEGGFSPNHSLLLTDNTFLLDQTAAYPNRENIQARIAQVCQQLLQPGDVLWCFFSGYGVQHHGQDYLMPIDGDPSQIATTGIAIESLFDAFSIAATDNIVLLLDINRSQSATAGAGVGAQTAALAQQFGIPVILSCLPDQFSHETLALRQGLFTAALIESMRYRGCVTLEHMVQYLQGRLPELSEHHWRPRQDPLAIVPAAKTYLLLVPAAAAARLGSIAPPPDPPALPDRLTADAAIPDMQQAAIEDITLSSSVALLEPPPDRMLESPDAAGTSIVSETDAPEAPTARVTLPPAPPPLPPVAAPEPPAPEPIDSTIDDGASALFWRRVLSWGGVIVSALFVGVLLRNCGTLTAPLSSRPSPSGSPSSSPRAASADQFPVFSDSTTIDPSALQVSPGSPLQAVQITLQAQDFETAKQQLQAIPAAQRDADYTRFLEITNRGLLSSARTTLNRVRGSSSQNQVSDFVDAMKVARQIRPDEPLYAEAQQDIDRWSQVVFDMAQGIANRRNDGLTPVAAANYSAAIATARYIPTDRPALYDQAQQAIDRWSRTTLELAKARAAEGYIDVAIQAAELVPPDTPVYAAAQETIATWRNEPIENVIPDAPPPEAPSEEAIELED